MSVKYLPFPLFFSVLLFVDTTIVYAGDSQIAEKEQSRRPHTIWQDPFYQGPFGVRMWTDVTGDHRVEGRFVELLPGEIVRLQRPNGRFLRIPLNQLSRADRDLVDQITLK